MDAKVNGHVVTPRIGKPVEIQALWINALWIGQSFSSEWLPLFTKASESFSNRFWNDAKDQLYDVVDVDHQRGTMDPLVRPNQIFSVGGLPLVLLPMERARRVVTRQRPFTPFGVAVSGSREPDTFRTMEVTMASGQFIIRNSLAMADRSFVEAWVRVRGETTDAKSWQDNDFSRLAEPSRQAASDMCQKLRMPNRPIRRGAAHSRPGRWRTVAS
jgi:hypothetical protein